MQPAEVSRETLNKLSERCAQISQQGFLVRADSIKNLERAVKDLHQRVKSLLVEATEDSIINIALMESTSSWIGDHFDIAVFTAGEARFALGRFNKRQDTLPSDNRALVAGIKRSLRGEARDANNYCLHFAYAVNHVDEYAGKIMKAHALETAPACMKTGEQRSWLDRWYAKKHYGQEDWQPALIG